MLNSYGTAYVKPLDAVTVAGAGPSVSTNYTRHAFQLFTATGSTVTLEGTLDPTETTWFSLGTLNTNGSMAQVIGTFMFVRARVSTLAGGDTVTVIYKGLYG